MIYLKTFFGEYSKLSSCFRTTKWVGVGYYIVNTPHVYFLVRQVLGIVGSQIEI